MIKSKSFAIIGGGIGGLTTAIALHRKGHNVTVYESAPSFKTVGAGIVLAPNAIRAFQSIDIAEQVIAAGNQLRKFSIRDSAGASLSASESEKLALRFGPLPTVGLHRADLHRVLLNQLPEDSVLTNRLCTAFQQDRDGVVIRFSDGSTVKADYVIAADGIHSIFRKALIPEATLRYSGSACWRAVIGNRPADFPNGEASEYWGRGKRFGMVPLAGSAMYWYATLNVPTSEASSFSADVNKLESLFQGFAPIVCDVISRTTNDQLIRNDIFDFKPVTKYAFGNIVLTGDAAHATTPNLGQGACMAIEDAVVLAACVDREKDTIKAFRDFESRRVDRNRRIVNASYSMGKVAQVSNPLLMRLRNAAMRATPKSISESQLKFLYNVSFAD